MRLATLAVTITSITRLNITEEFILATDGPALMQQLRNKPYSEIHAYNYDYHSYTYHAIMVYFYHHDTSSVVLLATCDLPCLLLVLV